MAIQGARAFGPVTSIRIRLAMSDNDAPPLTPKRLWHLLGVGPALWCAAIAGIALIAAIQLGIIPTGAAPVPTHAARLVGPDQGVVAIAAYVDDNGRFLVEPAAEALADADTVAVWIMIGIDAPVFVGFVPDADTLLDVDLPRRLRAQVDGAVVVLTQETTQDPLPDQPSMTVLGQGAMTPL